MHHTCAACGKHFTGLSAFDMHRTGDYAELGERQGTRRCMTAQEMKAIGIIKNKAGLWTAEPNTHKQKARRKRAA